MKQIQFKFMIFCKKTPQEEENENEKVRKIGNYLYRPINQIGKGNFSTVYKGVEETSGHPVAVKMIKPAVLQSGTARKLLENQLTIIQKLKHPNVVNFYNVITDANSCYIIAEFCECGDLDKLLKAKRCFPQKIISKAVYDIFMGLEYLHQNAVVHRDLKLANIFLTSNGTAKIADFGFATKSDVLFKDITIGSPIYMSPEGLLKNQYGPKTDVWAFGIIIYQLLHGDTPLSYCRTDQELKQKILSPPVLHADISPELREFILGCLMINVQQRYSIPQIKKTKYMKKVIAEIQGHKLDKATVSTQDSIDTKTTEKACPIEFSKFETVLYDQMLSLIHYCRLLHKTASKVHSDVFPAWLVKMSFNMMKCNISEKDKDSTQVAKMKQVVTDYHNKYQKEYEILEMEGIFSQDVLKQCQKLKNIPEIKKEIKVLLSQTQLLKCAFMQRNLQIFAKNSTAKSFLSSK